MMQFSEQNAISLTSPLQKKSETTAKTSPIQLPHAAPSNSSINQKEKIIENKKTPFIPPSNKVANLKQEETSLPSVHGKSTVGEGLFPIKDFVPSSPLIKRIPTEISFQEETLKNPKNVLENAEKRTQLKPLFPPPLQSSIALSERNVIPPKSSLQKKSETTTKISPIELSHTTPLSSLIHHQGEIMPSQQLKNARKTRPMPSILPFNKNSDLKREETASFSVYEKNTIKREDLSPTENSVSSSPYPTQKIPSSSFHGNSPLLSPLIKGTATESSFEGGALRNPKNILQAERMFRTLTDYSNTPAKAVNLEQQALEQSWKIFKGQITPHPTEGKENTAQSFSVSQTSKKGDANHF